MLTIEGLYNYVFGEGARIDVSKVPSNQQENAKNKKKESIKNLFSDITKKPDLSKKFRFLLRELDNKDLEDHLYENHTDDLDDEDIQVPSKGDIENEFHKLDQKYKYFSENKTAKENFIILFKAAKLMGDFVEKNNDPNDSLASEHAYKMLVLFGAHEQNPLNSVEKSISSLGKSIHDSLIKPIPVNDPPLHLKEWQALIQKKGHAAISLFQRAGEIEKHLKRAPKNFDEAKTTALELGYKRSKENLELAKLCLEHNIPETVFDKCLSIKPKKSDQLPNVIIDGKDINQPGYYLVKLSIEDPRAYILGDITDCCQSIGGHSEECVIDGITREQNGFYVLLKKNKNSKTNTVFNKEGKIDYDNYEIVGQTYCWLSKMGNFTLDSFEGLGSVKEEVIVSFINEFGKRVLNEKDTDILRVTIGLGGKTPEYFLSDKVEEVKHPERIAKGMQYLDSKTQALVVKNEQLETDLKNKIQKIYNITPEFYAKRQMEVLLIDEKNREFYKKTLGESYNDFVRRACNNGDFFQICFILHQVDLLNEENFKLLNNINPKNKIKSFSKLESIDRFYDTDPLLLNQNNVQMLLTNSGMEHHIIRSYKEGRSLLYETHPDLDNTQNRQRLAQAGLYARGMARIFSVFYPSPVQEGTFKLLQQVREAESYFDTIAFILSKLKTADAALLNNKTLELIVPYYTEELWQIKSAVSQLIQAASKFQTVKSPSTVGFFKSVITENPTWITKENFELIAKNPKCASKIVEGLVELYKTDPILVTDEHRKLLAEAGDAAPEVAAKIIKDTQEKYKIY